MISRAGTGLAWRPAARAFPILFAAFLVVALLQGQKPFYYDSGIYWALSESFVKAGHFSFLNFENVYSRGYGLPFIYFLIRNAGETLGLKDASTVAIFNAAVFAAVAAALAPALAEVAMPGRVWGIGRRLLLGAILLVFWRGSLNYPLSDFVALALGLLAICAVARGRSAPAFALAGGAAALALDVRPAYLLLVPIVAILFLWRWYSDEGRKSPRWLLGLALLLAAIVLVSLPQSISQHEHFDSWTPVPGGSDLAGLQYTDGLIWQLYDTYVGGSGAEAQMTYLDHDTADILEGLKEERVKTTGQYAELVIDHPVTMAGVFLRHLVNGLDERYSTPYVEHLEGTSNKLLRVAGFLLVFAALVRIFWGEARRRLGVGRARYLVALLLCAASSVASSVETRYMLPVFLLAPILVLAPGGWPSPVAPVGSPLRRYRPLIAIAAAAAVFFGVVAIIVTATSNSLVLGGG